MIVKLNKIKQAGHAEQARLYVLPPHNLKNFGMKIDGT